jgi:uncharacterized protein YlxW (UPF0749 family)
MLGHGPKVRIWACCAVMATVVSGAGVAAAAPVSRAAQWTLSASQADPSSSQWSVNGSNSVDVGYDGQSLVYSVTFTQSGSSLSGTLDDPYYPTSGPVSGSISGDSITFTFSYPSGSIQGTRTYTGTISQSGAISGTWTQTGDESPDNGTWSLANNAVAASSSPPTQACPTATAAYHAAHKALDHLLNQLRDAQNRQTDAQNRVTDLTRQVNADKALIAQVNALLQTGQNDTSILNQDIAGLTSTVGQLLGAGFGEAADRLINRARVITLNSLDPAVGETNEALANSFFQRAAAAEGEEAAAAASLDLVSANLVQFLGLTGVAAMYFEVGRLSAEVAALGVVLAQLSPLQDQYHHAEDQIGNLQSKLATAQDELNADNADVSTLSTQTNTAQAAAQAALNAMTSACEPAPAG